MKPALKTLNLNIKPEDNVGSSLQAAQLNLKLQQSPFTPKTPSNTEQFGFENVDPHSPGSNLLSTPTSNFVEPRKPSSIRKPQKRIRSPNLDGECSPGMYAIVAS